MTHTDLSYRQAAVQSGTGFSFLIAMYDTLARDLQRAANAEQSNDLEMRSRKLSHAFMVLAHLEECLNRGAGGELADTLRAFYASVRQEVTEAQFTRSASILEDQSTRILKLREEWQRLDLRETDEMMSATQQPVSNVSWTATDQERNTWSA